MKAMKLYKDEIDPDAFKRMDFQLFLRDPFKQDAG